jgi:disulfide bond formation protein DsbB
MDATHFHLVVTHALIFLAPVAVVLLLWGGNPLQKQMRRAGYAFALVAALGGWAAHFSGEEAEERVESLEWADHDLIHEHEEVAEVTHLWVIGLTAVALLGLFFGEHERWGKPLRWTVVFLATMTTFAGAYTANYGGKIRHTELRAAPQGAESSAHESVGDKPSSEEDHEDRDHKDRDHGGH